MKTVKYEEVAVRDGRINHEVEIMTGSQKAFLLGILGELGITGEKAIEYIKKLLFVDSLKKVNRKEVDALINSLMAAKKGGESHDRSSVK